MKIIKKEIKKNFTVDIEVEDTPVYQLKNGIVSHNTSSLVLGTSSGVHAWHNDYYLRRIRVGKNESIYTYLAINHPELVEDENFRPHEQAVITVPQKAPEGAIYRHESPMQLLERVRRLNTEWVRAGHRDGQNTHNVSVTVSIKKEAEMVSKKDENGKTIKGTDGKVIYEPKKDENGKTINRINEWGVVGEWMWYNRDTFNGISVLPYDGGSYIQAPFSDCTKERYNELMKTLSEVDLTKVVELEDNTDLSGEIACASGQCEIDVDMSTLKEQ